MPMAEPQVAPQPLVHPSRHSLPPAASTAPWASPSPVAAVPGGVAAPAAQTGGYAPGISQTPSGAGLPAAFLSSPVAPVPGPASVPALAGARAPAAVPARPVPVGAIGVRPIPVTPGAARPLPLGTTVGGAATDTEGDEDEQHRPPPAALRAAPPWLVSLVVHMVVLIVLGMIFLPQALRRTVDLEAIFAERIGEQLEDDSVALTTETPMDVEEQIITPKDLPPVDDPFAAPTELEINFFDGATASSQIDAPVIGLALTGREPGMKEALLAAYGGTATTEAAVLAGLEWLVRNQNPDGSWSLVGPYVDGAQSENRTAATAMALLAFQGNGQTHQVGKHKAVVARGWRALLKMQNAGGDFWQGGIAHQRLYSQAQATIAACELYGMTKDKELQRPAQLALDYAVKIQDQQGGWRYVPGEDSDTSVTGWFVMALQSGRMAGLEVPSPTLERVSRYLDLASSEGGVQYGYKAGNGGTPPMTAEGLLCRQYLGWKHDDPRLGSGVNLVSSHPIDWTEQNVYYWYYATQVLHHMEGEHWDAWNAVMRQSLPERQVKTGKERGSWSPTEDRWGIHGGRLYTTCLCIYMLEVYYRHLPIYSQVYKHFTR